MGTMSSGSRLAERDEQDSLFPRLRRSVFAHDTLSALRDEVGLRQETIAISCGTSVRTVRNWETGQPVRARNADRLSVLADVVLILGSTLRGAGVDQWLRARIRTLNGSRPMDLLGEEQSDAVLSAARSFAGGDYV